MPEVSILIRAKNEGRSLDATLSAIDSQSFRDFEVILVDSGSSDGTVAVAASHGARIVTMAPEAFTYGRALNLGCREARGNVVVLLSAHALPSHREWLAHLFEPFVDPNVAGVMGRELPRQDCNPFDRRGLERRYEGAGAQTLGLSMGNGIGFGAANSAVRRKVWESLPFDESLPYAEDFDWGRRALAAGFELRYAPFASAYHSHNESLAGISRRFYRQGVAERHLGLSPRPRTALGLIPYCAVVAALEFVYALGQRDRFRWCWLAPGRRFAIVFSRYKGFHGIAEDAPFFEATLGRALTGFVRKLNAFLAGRAATLARVTGKTRHEIHPKHLIEGGVDRDWYLPYLPSRGPVLDAGCSHGGHTLRAASSVELICGFDRELGHLRVALARSREQSVGNAHFHAADGERQWPYLPGRFRCVLALDVLEHVVRREAFLEECRRVLAPEGKLLVAVPNRETSFKKKLRRLGISSLADPDHKIEYEKSEIEADLEAHGFRVESCTPVVYDTPWYGVYDIIGGLSLSLYRRAVLRKRRMALQNPEESTGFRLVAGRR